MRRRFPCELVLAASLSCSVASAAQNVILMIADGQGYNQAKVAELYSGTASAQSSFGVQYGVSNYPLNLSSTPTGGHTLLGSYTSSTHWASFSAPASGATDSAAAATALATGVKTYNNAINWDNNPVTTGAALPTIFELASSLGKSTGAISTVEWSHATPAAFGAHNISRNNYTALANEMLGGNLDVIMGAGHPEFTDSHAAYGSTVDNTRAQYVGGLATWNALKSANASPEGTYNGFRPVFSRSEFEALANGMIGALPSKVVGTAQVATTLQQARSSGNVNEVHIETYNDVPSAATMARGALNVLAQNPNGFFVMMETGGAVDWASHSSQRGRVIEEQMAFNDSVAAVLQWLTDTGHLSDTLLIVTADHETGQLWGNNPANRIAGAASGFNSLTATGSAVLNEMLFSSGGHTNSLVPLYATGPGSELFSQYATGSDLVRGAYLDNTDVFKVMAAAIPEPASLGVAASASLLLLCRRRHAA